MVQDSQRLRLVLWTAIVLLLLAGAIAYGQPAAIKAVPVLIDRR